MRYSRYTLEVDVDILSAEHMLNVAMDVLNSPSLAAAAASFTKDAILSRTARGRDVNNSPFAPYSPNTGKRGRVNLRDTGAMLGSIGYSASSPTNAEVFCNSPVANYHMDGTKNMPIRRFFGFNDNDYGALVNLLYFQPLATEEPVHAPLRFNENAHSPGPATEPDRIFEEVSGNIVRITLEDGTVIFTNKPEQYR